MDRRVSLLLLTAALLQAPPLLAQSVTAGGGVYAQDQPGFAPTRWGWTVLLGTEIGGGPVPFRAEASYARVDYTVVGEDYHTNTGNLVVGFTNRGDPRDALSINFFLGLGARVEDVVPEGDSVTTSATWKSLVSPGFTIERRIGGSSRVTLLVRDYISGLLGSVIDSSERDVRHSFSFVLGLTR